MRNIVGPNNIRMLEMGEPPIAAQAAWGGAISGLVRPFQVLSGHFRPYHASSGLIRPLQAISKYC